jgi:soluble lytic murein transglycosylase-like protein
VNPGVVDENLKGGATYLQSLIKKYDGDVGKALAAYNAGPGRVDKGGPLPQETQSYVAKIMMKLRGDKRDKEQR